MHTVMDARSLGSRFSHSSTSQSLTAVASAVLLAGLLFVTMLVLLCLGWTGARAAIATRNLVAWEREWAAVEPEWRRKA